MRVKIKNIPWSPDFYGENSISYIANISSFIQTSRLFKLTMCISHIVQKTRFYYLYRSKCHCLLPTYVPQAHYFTLKTTFDLYCVLVLEWLSLPAHYPHPCCERYIHMQRTKLEMTIFIMLKCKFDYFSMQKRVK